jgi:FkbM family methyltransferase
MTANPMQTTVLTQSFRRLAGRPDFRNNPVKAIAKRLAWRLRWLATSRPIELEMSGGFRICAPKGAVGALIYYLGNSEPESARIIESFLRPGMVFFDVGAHIGEYTLMASRLVGPNGAVHAFEAQPDTFAILEQNCLRNRVSNVKLNSCAVVDAPGTVEFDICAEPAMSSMAAAAALPRRRLNRIVVPAISLDRYCQVHDTWPDLLKVDVEGAEWLVLRGAAEVLRRSSGPAVIFESLPETYSRFGYTAESVNGYLQSLGYQITQSAGYNLVALKQAR